MPWLEAESDILMPLLSNAVNKVANTSIGDMNKSRSDSESSAGNKPEQGIPSACKQ